MSGFDLSGLKAVAAELNASSDALKAVLADVESALKDVSLGVEAWATFAWEGGRQDFQYAIGYAKPFGKWGLALRTTDMDSESDVVMLNDAPRVLRIEAAGHIPELLTALEARASELLDATHKRIADLTTEELRDDREPEPSAADEYEDRRDHERAHGPGRLG